MVTEERMKTWERQEALVTNQLKQLSHSANENSCQLNILKLDVVAGLAKLNTKMVEFETKVKVQSRYIMALILTMLPANFALLYKVFFP